MIRRPCSPLLSILINLVSLAVVVGGVGGVVGGVGVVGSFLVSIGGVVLFFFLVGVVSGVVSAANHGITFVLYKILGRGHSVRGRRSRSSGLPGGVGWLRLGGTLRRLLRACTSVDRLVDYLLDRTVDKLPAAASARFAEEWQDHRRHYAGWRLVWWALCVRATALRTVAALGPARLPLDS